MTHRSWVDRDGNLVSQPTLTVEELQGRRRRGARLAPPVACHAYNGIGLQRALDGGCDCIEHGLEITDAEIAQMLRQGTWYVPTLAVYYDDLGSAGHAGGPARPQARGRCTASRSGKALHAGVKIAFGTDVGGFVWSDPIAQEFAREVEFGMTPDAGHPVRDLKGRRTA